MKIIMAKSAGFCFGVKRATNLAFAAADQYTHICSHGPIIHSPQMVEKLAEQGVDVVSDIEDIPNGAVIIRSHGVTSAEFQQILDRDLDIIDATCPFVKKAQDYAKQLSEEGYSVVLAGEAEHPEVQGIISYAKDTDVYTVANLEEADKLPRIKKIGVVAQTTQSYDNFCQIVESCLSKCQEIRVFNTICDATTVRQNEASAIASEVELMLVIGGYNSANTTRLARICKEIQSRTFHVETAQEIETDWFENIASVGITAGASTPQWIIEDVYEKVSQVVK